MNFDFIDFINPASVFIVGMILWVIIESIAKKMLSKEDLAKLEAIGRIAVMAAEQLAKIEAIPANERKSYALNLVRDELAKHNIKISESLINAVIEASVTGLKITKSN